MTDQPTESTDHMHMLTPTEADRLARTLHAADGRYIIDQNPDPRLVECYVLGDDAAHMLGLMRRSIDHGDIDAAADHAATLADLIDDPDVYALILTELPACQKCGQPPLEFTPHDWHEQGCPGLDCRCDGIMCPQCCPCGGDEHTICAATGEHVPDEDTVVIHHAARPDDFDATAECVHCGDLIHVDDAYLRTIR